VPALTKGKTVPEITRDHPRLREIARYYPEVTRDYPRLREITRVPAQRARPSATHTRPSVLEYGT